jgi:hypothetical protein
VRSQHAGPLFIGRRGLDPRRKGPRGGQSRMGDLGISTARGRMAARVTSHGTPRVGDAAHRSKTERAAEG